MYYSLFVYDSFPRENPQCFTSPTSGFSENHAMARTTDLLWFSVTCLSPTSLRYCNIIIYDQIINEKMKKRAIATLWRLYHARSDTIIWRHAVCALSFRCIMVVKQEVGHLHPIAIGWTSLVAIRTSLLLRCRELNFRKNEIQQLKAIK